MSHYYHVHLRNFQPRSHPYSHTTKSRRRPNLISLYWSTYVLLRDSCMALRLFLFIFEYTIFYLDCAGWKNRCLCFILFSYLFIYPQLYVIALYNSITPWIKMHWIKMTVFLLLLSRDLLLSSRLLFILTSVAFCEWNKSLSKNILTIR